MKSVTLNSEDGKDIAAVFYNKHLENPKGFIVYTHMMPATKESWEPLAEKLENLGYVGIAIDMRGHGESTDGPEGYKNFDIEEHRNGKYDIDAAVKYLDASGANKEKIHFIGASIGANLSLEYLSKKGGKSAVLLSPGLDYAKIEAVALVHALRDNKGIMLVSSTDDRIEGNAEGNKKLFKEIPENVQKKLIIYERANHGTAMFKTDEEPNLIESIINFIEEVNE